MTVRELKDKVDFLNRTMVGVTDSEAIAKLTEMRDEAQARIDKAYASVGLRKATEAEVEASWQKSMALEAECGNGAEC